MDGTPRGIAHLECAGFDEDEIGICQLRVRHSRHPGGSTTQRRV